MFLTHPPTQVATYVVTPSLNNRERGIVIIQGISLNIHELAKFSARDLRKKQTEAEEILWQKLRNRKFAGLKFVRQHPIYYFKNDRKKFLIADFYCNNLKLIIEVDGRIHEKQKNYDRIREELLEIKLYKIIRFKN
jgi:very-short-patch-repair endonuclease